MTYKSTETLVKEGFDAFNQDSAMVNGSEAADITYPYSDDTWIEKIRKNSWMLGWSKAAKELEAEIVGKECASGAIVGGTIPTRDQELARILTRIKQAAIALGFWPRDVPLQPALWPIIGCFQCHEHFNKSTKGCIDLSRHACSFGRCK